MLTPSIVRQALLSNVPYVKVSSINVTSTGIYIKLAIIKQGNLYFMPINGWVEVVNTGQYSNVNSSLVAVLPLTPQYIGLGSVSVKGIVYGYLNGSRAYIAFFDIAPIHIINSIKYCRLHIRRLHTYSILKCVTWVPATINYVVNVSLFTTYTHQYVFNTVNCIFNISLGISPGNHLIRLIIPIRPSSVGYTYIYGCSMELNAYYTLYMLTSVTYIYPTGNVTEFKVFIKIEGGSS